MNHHQDTMHEYAYDKYKCQICHGDVRKAEDCGGPRHAAYELLVSIADDNAMKELGLDDDAKSITEIQRERHGIYVDPETGKIVKAKALNNPETLG